ncbi:MAG: UbiX family flavin prenyltransferase [Holophagales bacterium]|jgi:4-hydroxy-3-polyprenylbenzoate decarboxylase|nr:UbiX family flavin prenyltransferase [Holophagales bacterium]
MNDNNSMHKTDASRRFVLAVTGASGAPFADALIKRMAQEPTVAEVMLISTPTGRRCFLGEVGCSLDDYVRHFEKISTLDENDLGAEISSGSARHGGMAVVPCSMGTLGRITSGTSDNLIIRAADVCLKEKRPLVLCVRESPLNRIHLENMLRAHDAGSIVMPLAPTFYHHPKTIEDICDAFATRVMERLGMVQEDGRNWSG